MLKNYFEIPFPVSMRVKNIFIFFLFTAAFSFVTQAQETTPQLLKEPGNWSFERFALPPGFAPGFPYKGAEELRFSPGMFSKDSASYFTYCFVAELDNTATISQDNIRNYLLEYFKGLCSSTASDRKLSVDTSKITVAIEKKKSTGANEIIYNAVLHIFGVFADGAPVKLNMEIKVLNNTAAKKTYLVFIASPQEKTNEVWKELYMIREDFVMPGQ